MANGRGGWPQRGRNLDCDWDVMDRPANDRSVSSAATAPEQRGGLRSRLRAIPLLLGAAALVQPLARLLARYDWRADILTHLQEAALGMTLIAIAGLVWRHRRIAAVLTALAIFQVVPLLRYSGSNPVLPEPASSARLRILMANVLAHNSDHERLAELIRRERPDVVGLVEVTHAWLHDLADVRAEYPYRYEAPGGTQGLALWFRERPLADAEVEPLVAGGWPVLHAIIEFGGLPRHLWLVHPASPLRHQRRRPGNSELVALGERVQQTGGSRVVIGDLNSTDGSPHFSDFLDTSGLRDTRLGFGRQPSWPVWSPYRITIDHAFLSPDLAVASRRLGPDIGSDHRPLILDVALAAGAVSATKAATQASQSSP